MGLGRSPNSCMQLVPVQVAAAWPACSGCADAGAVAQPCIDSDPACWLMPCPCPPPRQMDVEFSELEGAGGHAEPRWVPLHLPGKGGKAKPAGEILVAVWWGEQAGAGEAGGSAHSTLCAPPGVAKRVPLVVHTARGSLYEEPLIACLAVVLEGVEAVPLHAAAAPAAGAAASQPVLAEPAAGNGTGAGGSPAAGSKLGALMPFRRKTPAAFAG